MPAAAKKADETISALVHSIAAFNKSICVSVMCVCVPVSVYVRLGDLPACLPASGICLMCDTPALLNRQFTR